MLAPALTTHWVMKGGLRTPTTVLTRAEDEWTASWSSCVPFFQHHACTCILITLRNTTCKLLLPIRRSHMNSFLSIVYILDPQQHSFWIALLTITQVVEVTHDVSQDMNNNFQFNTILIYFVKPFANVLHSRMITKIFFVILRTLKLSAVLNV